MKNQLASKYSKRYPCDKADASIIQGRGANQFEYPYRPERENERVRGIDLEQSSFIEKVWRHWVKNPFEIGVDGMLAVWGDLPAGYRMAKIRNINPTLDRCLLECEDDPSHYAIFDLKCQKRWITVGAPADYIVVCYEIFEYQISDDEAALITLSL